MLFRVSSCVASVTFVLIISSYYYAFVSILLFLGYLYAVFHKDIHVCIIEALMRCRAYFCAVSVAHSHTLTHQ
jgi:hypothetical protein